MHLIDYIFRRKLKMALLTILAACCTGAFANELHDNIDVKGGTVVEDGDDVIITYTAEKIATEGAGKLEFKAGSATARVLAIGGGGGGGGTLNKTSGQWGAGGGGGAGGMVEASGLAFKGYYAISVGAGGTAVEAKTHAEGGDGGNTTITKDGVQVSGIAVAKGGGGGGAGGSQGQTATTVTTTYTGKGRAGGSGGGGSQTYKSSSASWKKAGGNGTSQQGNKGGSTTVNNTSYWIGAGGGGAGSQGKDVESKNQSGGAPGGDGKSSNITGSDVMYASGGAGGALNLSSVGIVAAKSGGGGSGGTDDNTGSRDGSPATGGGGGGASNTQPSGAGGSGVLIIRLSNYVAGGVIIPTIDEFVYDGQPHTATADTVYYTVSGVKGNVTETNAGDYTLRLTLTAAGKSIGWDNPLDPRISGDTCDVDWSIAKKPIDKPTTVEASYTYEIGVEQTGYTNGTWYTVSGDVKATNAGTYHPAADLRDSANTKWADDAATPRTLTWTISKLAVEKPEATVKSLKWTYTGNVQTGFVENVTLYTFTDANRQTNAGGPYVPTATLVDPANTEWADATYKAVVSRNDFTWTIGSKEVTKPTTRTGLVFDNTEQAAFEPLVLESTEYTLSGHLQTDAGDYQATVTLNNSVAQNYKWKNGNYDPLTRDWSIAKRTVDLPQEKGATPTYTYDGTEKEPFTNSVWWTIYEGTGKATDADDYVCKIQLNYNTDAVTNVTWTGGSAEKMAWDWKINAKVVDIPVATTNTYAETTKGKADDYTLLTIPADADYELDTTVKNPEFKQSQARSYAYTLKLKDPNNTVWNNGSSDPKVVTCVILKADNEIYGLTMKDWQDGSTASEPSITDVKFGQKTLVQWSYSESATGPWSPNKLTDNGYHYVRASFGEQDNWNAVESVKRYCVWTHPSERFSDYVDITLGGYTGSTALTDFPVLIRIQQPTYDSTGAVTGGLPGFTYERAGKTGADIRFLYDNATPTVTNDDQLLPYEIEKWDTTGESLVWVKVPKVSGTDTKIRMYWHTDDPKSANDPTLVWSDYAGVWHMDDAEDSSPYAASGELGAKAVSRANGLICGAYGAKRTGTNPEVGALLTVQNYSALNALSTTGLTASFWVYLNSSEKDQNAYAFARREDSQSPSWGTYFLNNSGNAVRIVYSSNNNYYTRNSSLTAKSWQRVDVVMTQAKYAYYVNGNQVVTGANTVALPTSDYAFTIGGMSGTGAGLLNGDIDEFRLYSGELSADRIKAEYQTVMDTNFATFGPVCREGVFVDYWTEMPKIDKSQWEVGEITNGAIHKGELKFGAVTNWFVTMPSETVTNATPPSVGGTYQAVFDRIPEPDPSTVFDILGGRVTREYTVIWHNTYTNIGDTADGRILLGNNDSMPGHPVTGQAYWQTSVTAENNTFWQHLTPVDPPSTAPYLGDECEHFLYLLTSPQETNRLWHLKDVRMGSNCHKNGAMVTARNYLPWTETSSTHTQGAELSLKEVTYLIMRNMENAAIYSPCYTSGVGTVYFDGVNAFTEDTGAKVVVEIATETGLGLPPTDKNCEKDGDPYYYLTHDEKGELPKDKWTTVRPIVLIKTADAAEFVEDKTQTFENDAVKLAIATGKSTAAFYRIMVKVNYRGPIRFRIRRPEKSPFDSPDSAGLILLDNVIVSPPAMSANLTALGHYDKELVGKQTLGQACAFDKPFPGRTDASILGRAGVEYVKVPGIACDESKFVASARLHYRWRYLNQAFEPAKLNGADRWNTVYLDHVALADGVMKTVKPLEFPASVGDLEWYYDMTLNAPTYKLVDYSGLTFEKPTGDFTEEIRSVTNHIKIDDGDRLASGGTDWFLRLREGKSDWQRMQVVITSDDKSAEKLVGTYDMELVDDNMWRAFVVVPTNAEGTCSFRFKGLNRQEGSPTAIAENETVYGLSVSGQTASIPASGKLTAGGEGVAFDIDHQAGYLEFKMSDRFLTFQVGRAEYVDFNHWNDARTEGDKFRVNAFETNSVNIADMKIEKAPTGTWPLFVATNSQWDAAFIVNDYDPTEGRFIKEIFHQSHETPNELWTAKNITFVSENFAPNTDDGRKNKSGMAGKLLGSGSGMMDFSYDKAPEGIEKIDLSTRLGQSYTFDSFTYNKASFDKQNYLFFVPVTMSHMTETNECKSAGDMAVGASVSLVGYHSAETGCYEVRAERLFSGNTVRLSIYKWSVQGLAWTSTRLAYRDFTGTCWSEEKSAKGVLTPESERTFYGMFISLDTNYYNDDPMDRPIQTRIICALSNGQKTGYEDPWKYYSYSETGEEIPARKNVKWYGLTYEDTDSPYGWGCYGVSSKDCPAQFVMPAHQDKPFTGGIPEQPNPKDKTDKKGAGGKYFENEPLKFDEATPFVDDRKELPNRRHWAAIAGRCESFTNSAGTATHPWIGLHAPTNLTQKLELYLKKRNAAESTWTLKSKPIEVSGYGFSNHSFLLREPGQWDVRLRTGSEKAIDVVVDNVKQWKWQADSSAGSVEREFYYTQCCIETNKSAKTNFVRLQPARATTTRPLSIRSPYMEGLGKLTFGYANADANAEIWVQVATNAVWSKMEGEGGYNESLKYVEFGGKQEIGVWMNVAKFSAKDGTLETAGKDAKYQSVYLGWHDNANNPCKGIYRLFVPTNVIAEAIKTAATSTNDAYGQITITALTCSDEPGYTDRSWRGWNMRTIGDQKDAEQRMNLVDMKIEDGGNGLVAALNNSLDNVYLEKTDKKPIDPNLPDTDTTPAGETMKRLRNSYPTIYSPLMHPKNARSGVGSVTFKARLYSTNGVPETVEGGKVLVYGSQDPTGTDWTLLATHAVNSCVFSNFTWSAGTETYTAVKLEVHTRAAETDRVIIDEIVIGEKVPPTIGFEYARPFRNDLFVRTAIPEARILSPAEQPLAGESWGVQTKLTLQQLTDEIDVEKGFKVYFRYHRGLTPWGYEQWKDSAEKIELVAVGNASNLVFRSVGDTPKSLVSPAAQSGEVVQFMLTVRYSDRGGKEDEIDMGADWEQPSWFYPLDYNETYGGYEQEARFSAYTVLDTVSPGRAWINEVSWNDGKTGGDTHQYLEVCIPSGVDMTGWKLRYTDLNENSAIFAKFGVRDIPKTKVSEYAVSGYEFFVFQSPATRDAGGIKDPVTGKVMADATWNAETLGSSVSSGTLNYSHPYQFELIRPSGIIEHQFVLDGTNTMTKWPSVGKLYEGTNLVAKLNDDGSPKRFYGGHDLEFKRGTTTFSSIGVTGGTNSTDTAKWPGGKETWSESMGFTPGRLNEGQTIPIDWFLAPNGTNSWVYFIVNSDHLSQRVGTDTAKSILAVIPQGRSTNITYTVDNWYEANVLNGTNVVVAGGLGTFGYSFTPTGTTYVTASAVPQSKLADDFGLDASNPYTPAVRRWLETRYGDYTADDIRLAYHKGLAEEDTVNLLTLTDMYWLDIPPVPVTEAEKTTNDGTNWWLRAGLAKLDATSHIITRERASGTVTYTNKQIEVTMYVSNACTQVKWAPKALQGLGNEISTNCTSVWTSETFKVNGKLGLDDKTSWVPFRIFTFQDGSFSGPEGDATMDPPLAPFTTRIDILDPFQSPIGRNYDWDKAPNTKAYFKWALDTKEYPYTTEKLKADSTYKSSETIP